MGNIRRIWPLLFIATILSQPSIAEEIDLPLNPINDWRIVQFDDRCVATRKFGVADNPVGLELQRYDHWSGQFLAVIKGSKLGLRDSSPAATWLPEGYTMTEDLPILGTTANGQEWISFKNAMIDSNAPHLGGDEKEYEARGGPTGFKERIQTLRVEDVSENSILLATGLMSLVFDDLDDCMDNILRERGVPEEDLKRDDHRVELKNYRKLVRAVSLYLPATIRNRSKKTLLRFVVYLDENAMATHCVLSPLRGASKFGERACDLILEEGQFSFKENEEHKPAFFIFNFFVAP